MIIWAEGIVTGHRGSWTGAVELTVRRLDVDGDGSDRPGVDVLALAYTDLMPAPRTGDRVLLNVAALDQGLGTGGYALVIAALTAEGHLTGQPRQPQGHLVKARYLPHQAMVAGADEQGSAFHEALAEADSVDAMPVVVADLHSALPAVIAGIRAVRREATVVYVMSDQGALPLAFSRTVASLRAEGWLAGTVTAGQAFGGDLEAVNTHSALLTAKIALSADVTVVSQGPGNLGTGTRWGFSGVAVGETVNAVALLGGRPVAALRVSSADGRDRHRGLSHHTATALGRVATMAADLPVPELTGPFADELTAGLAELVRRNDRLRLVPVPTGPLEQALDDCPVPLSTMGRGRADDPEYFLASAAAGWHAASLLDGGQ